MQLGFFGVLEFPAYPEESPCGAVKRCEVCFVIYSYRLYSWFYFLGYSFVIDYVFMILYLVIPRPLRLLRSTDALIAGRCQLYHNGIDKANKTTFFSLYTLWLLRSEIVLECNLIPAITILFLWQVSIFFCISGLLSNCYERLYVKLNWEKGLLVRIGKWSFNGPRKQC